MDNLRTYIRYYKDIPFSESPFNDVDNLIFSSLVYLDFKKIIENPITLKEVAKKYFQNIDYKEIKKMPLVAKKVIDNFEILFNGKRYEDIIMSNYEKVVDNEKQFCALTYTLPDKTVYVAYEGTDESIIGWKEDFELIYHFPVPSQKMAIDYLNRVVKFSMKKVIVGGHSKGGNLAMTASMYARGYVRKRIVKVYNNDGPGFRKEQIESERFRIMEKKLKMIVPENCIVGFLLRHPDNYTVVKSNGRGIFAHDLSDWNCYGPQLIKGNLTEESKRLEKRVLNWLYAHNDEERKKFVEAIFDILEKSEIKTTVQLRQFKWNTFVKLIQNSRTMDKQSKELVISTFKSILFTKED